MHFPAAALAQGYADLGSEAGGYTPVTAPAVLEFPRDHGPHPGFRVEWWYLTANLKDADGVRYGVQWTLFRFATAPGTATEGWETPVIWMGHAAATDAERHLFAERFARGGIGQAGVTPDPFTAWIDDWSMKGGSGTQDPLDSLRITARGADFAYDLDAEATGPLVLHGDAGLSVKSQAGQASYYYSQPFYAMSGTLTLAGEDIAVTGSGWLDREWSSQPLSEDQQGWDWFSLHLDSGARVMAYRLRAAGGGSFPFGTWIAPDGTPTALGPDQIAFIPLGVADVEGRDVPVAWRIEIPGHGLAVDTEALNPQSWMGTTFAYWEGPIRFAGSHDGLGYLEMTGYE